jgi:hypothetical protein
MRPRSHHVIVLSAFLTAFTLLIGCGKPSADEKIATLRETAIAWKMCAEASAKMNGQGHILLVNLPSTSKTKLGPEHLESIEENLAQSNPDKTTSIELVTLSQAQLSEYRKDLNMGHFPTELLKSVIEQSQTPPQAICLLYGISDRRSLQSPRPLLMGFAPQGLPAAEEAIYGQMMDAVVIQRYALRPTPTEDLAAFDASATLQEQFDRELIFTDRNSLSRLLTEQRLLNH